MSVDIDVSLIVDEFNDLRNVLTSFKDAKMSDALKIAV